MAGHASCLPVLRLAGSWDCSHLSYCGRCSQCFTGVCLGKGAACTFIFLRADHVPASCILHVPSLSMACHPQTVALAQLACGKRSSSCVLASQWLTGSLSCHSYSFCLVPRPFPASACKVVSQAVEAGSCTQLWTNVPTAFLLFL